MVQAPRLARGQLVRTGVAYLDRDVRRIEACMPRGIGPGTGYPRGRFRRHRTVDGDRAETVDAVSAWSSVTVPRTSAGPGAREPLHVAVAQSGATKLPDGQSLPEWGGCRGVRLSCRWRTSADALAGGGGDDVV